MNLLTIGHQGVAGQRVVVLPAGQLTDAPHGAVHTAQTGAIALPPDHAFMIGRGYLAAVLDARAVSIEQELRVIDRAAIALVDAAGDDHASLLGGFGDRAGSLNSGRLVLAVRPNMSCREQILCGYGKLLLNRRFSAFEAIIATALPRTTPRNLSTSRLPLPSTRHVPRSNPHS